MHDRVSHAQLSAASIKRSLTSIYTLAGTLIAAVVLTATPAHAQLTSAHVEKSVAARTGASVVVELTQAKVTLDEKGVEHLTDAATVKPGDVIEYRAAYTNQSTKEVTGLVANLPIPEGMEYLPNSAKPSARLPTVATKDSQYGVEPLKRKNASQREELIPYGEYRAIRWQLGLLPAGGVTQVSARAKVETVVPISPKVSDNGSR